jgi:hypothetical protein
MDLVRTKLLRRLYRRISQCYCRPENLRRQQTGGLFRRKTIGRPLKRTAAVIETAREIMQNDPHTSLR